MGQDKIPQGDAPLESFTYAWTGTRYCDLQMSEANLRLIQDDLAAGYDKEDYIAVTALLIDRASRQVVLSKDLCLDNPYPLRRVVSRVDLWFHATIDEMEKEEAKNVVEVKVEVKNKEEPCQE